MEDHVTSAPPSKPDTLKLSTHFHVSHSAPTPKTIYELRHWIISVDHTHKYLFHPNLSRDEQTGESICDHSNY